MKASVFLRTLFFLLISGLAYTVLAQNLELKTENLKKLPDWIRKPEVLKQIDENRKIFVSVVEKDHFWTFKGAGKTAAERAEIVKNITDKELYHSIQLIKSADFTNSLLKLKILILNREMYVEILLKTDVTDDASMVHFEVKNGFLMGFAGEAQLFDIINARRTETFIFYNAHFSDKNHKVPTWFATIVVEGIMQRMAALLRENLEQKYQPKGIR